MRKVIKTFGAIFFAFMLICSTVNEVSAYTETSGSWSLNRVFPDFRVTVDLNAPWYSSGKDHNAFRVDVDCTYGKVYVTVLGDGDEIASYTYSEGDSRTIRITNCSPDKDYYVEFAYASPATQGEYSISSYRN